MADRFPSLEEIDEGHTGIADRDGAPEGDFLSRERAALGEDADLFAASTDQQKASVDEDEDDLLGGDYATPQQISSTAEDLDGFESSFPAIDRQNVNIGPGGTITNSALPFQGSGYTNYTPAVRTEDDTPPIREWRARRDADLARRDEASERKKQETISTAQRDIDAFYESYNRKIERQKAQTTKEAEEFLAKREDTTAGGTSWERIAKLADLSGKGQVGGGEGSTKKRMRELLLTLKGDKDAPGASGV